MKNLNLIAIYTLTSLLSALVMADSRGYGMLFAGLFTILVLFFFAKVIGLKVTTKYDINLETSVEVADHMLVRIANAVLGLTWLYASLGNWDFLPMLHMHGAILLPLLLVTLGLNGWVMFIVRNNVKIELIK